MHCGWVRGYVGGCRAHDGWVRLAPDGGWVCARAPRLIVHAQARRGACVLCLCICLRLHTPRTVQHGEWHEAQQVRASNVCLCVSCTRRPFGTRMYHSVRLLSGSVSGTCARARARVCSQQPISTWPPLHSVGPWLENPIPMQNIHEPFVSTVRGSMKPGSSPRSVVKSGNSVSTALASTPPGVPGDSPHDGRLPPGAWVGARMEKTRKRNG